MTTDEQSDDLSSGGKPRKIISILLGVAIGCIAFGIATFGTVIDVNVFAASLAASIGAH